MRQHPWQRLSAALSQLKTIHMILKNHMRGSQNIWHVWTPANWHAHRIQCHLMVESNCDLSTAKHASKMANWHTHGIQGTIRCLKKTLMSKITPHVYNKRYSRTFSRPRWPCAAATRIAKPQQSCLQIASHFHLFGSTHLLICSHSNHNKHMPSHCPLNCPECLIGGKRHSCIKCHDFSSLRVCLVHGVDFVYCTCKKRGGCPAFPERCGGYQWIPIIIHNERFLLYR